MAHPTISVKSKRGGLMSGISSKSINIGDTFPEAENATSLISGPLTVKFVEDNNGKLFSSAKVDVKVRQCELIFNKGLSSLLVYKIKKGDKKVPYFKIGIDRDTQIHRLDSTDFKRGFHLGSEQASFHTDETSLFDEFVQAIEQVVARLASTARGSPLSQSGVESNGAVISATLVADNSFVVGESRDTEKLHLGELDTDKSSVDGSSSVASRGATSAPRTKPNLSKSLSSSMGAGVGAMPEPVRRGASSHTGGRGSKRPSYGEDSNGERNNSNNSNTNSNNNVYNSASDRHSPSMGGMVDLPEAVQSPTNADGIARRSYSPSEQGHGRGDVHEMGVKFDAEADFVPIMVRPETMLQFGSPVPANNRSSGSNHFPPFPPPGGNGAAGATHSGDAALLLREIQALVAINGQLNDALEESEEERREQHERTMIRISNMQNMLDIAQAENKHLRSELEVRQSKDGAQERLEEQLVDCESQLRNANEEIYRLSNELKDKEITSSTALLENVSQMEQVETLVRKEIADLQMRADELAAEKADLLQELSDSEVRCTRLESDISSQLLQIERLKGLNAEVTEQLEQQIRKTQVEHGARITAESGGTNSTPGSPEFSGGDSKSSISKKTVAELEQALQRVTSDLLSSRGAEEAQKLSVMRLESLIKEQQLFAEDLSGQLTAAGDVKRQLTDANTKISILVSEATAYKAERDGLQRELTAAWEQTESVVASLKDARAEHLAAQDELRQSVETLQNKVQQEGVNSSHLTTEVSILQRRLDLTKEQLSQTEAENKKLKTEKINSSVERDRTRAELSSQLEDAKNSIEEEVRKFNHLNEMYLAESGSLKKRLSDANDSIGALKKTNKDILSRTQLLEEQNSVLNQSIHADKSSLAHLKQRYEVLENQKKYDDDMNFERMKELEDRLEDLSEQNSELRDRCTEKERLADEMTLSLSVAEGALNKSREDFQLLFREREQDRQKVAVRLQSMEEEMQRALARANHLESAVDDAAADKESSSASQAVLEKQLDNVRVELSEATAALQEQRDVCALLESKHKEREAELNAMRDKAVKREQELYEQERNVVAQLRSQIETLQGQNIDLHDQCRAREQDIAALEHALAAERSLVKDAEQTLEDYKKSTSEGSSLLFTMREQLNKRDDEIASLTEMLATAEREKESLADRLVKDDSAVTRLQKEIQALHATNSSLRDNAKTMMTESEEKESQLRKVTETLEEKSNELLQSQRSAARLQNEVSGLQAANHSLRESASSLQTSLEENKLNLTAATQKCEDKAEEVSSLTRTVARLNSEIQLLQNNNKTLRSSMSTVQGKADEAVLRVSSLNNELEDLSRTRGELSAAHSTLQTVQAQLAEAIRNNSELKNSNESLTRTGTAAHQRIEALAAQLVAAEKRVAECEGDLIPQLRETVESLSSQVRDVTSRAAKDKEKFDQAIESRDAKLADRKNKMHTLLEAHNELQAELTATKSKMSDMVSSEESKAAVKEAQRTLTGEINTLMEQKYKLMKENEALNKAASTFEKDEQKLYVNLHIIRTNLCNFMGHTSVGSAGTSEAKQAETAKESTEAMVRFIKKETLSLIKTCGDMQTLLGAQVETLSSELDLLLDEPSQHAQQSSFPASSPSAFSPATNTKRSSHHSPSMMNSTGGQQLQGVLSHHSTDSAAFSPHASRAEELMRRHQRTLDKFFYIERDRLLKLENQIHEERSLRDAKEALAEELQARIQTFESQVAGLKNSKAAAEQRFNAEISGLEKENAALLDQVEQLADKQRAAAADAAKHHEKQLSKQAAILQEQMTHRLAEQQARADTERQALEVRHEAEVSVLHNELDRASMKLLALQEQLNDAVRDRDLQRQAVSALTLRYEALQNEVDDKHSQLESCLAQLEKAELKAARESRQKLDLERSLRRFKSAPSSSSGGLSASARASTISAAAKINHHASSSSSSSSSTAFKYSESRTTAAAAAKESKREREREKMRMAEELKEVHALNQLSEAKYSASQNKHRENHSNSSNHHHHHQHHHRQSSPPRATTAADIAAMYRGASEEGTPIAPTVATPVSRAGSAFKGTMKFDELHDGGAVHDDDVGSSTSNSRHSSPLVVTGNQSRPSNISTGIGYNYNRRQEKVSQQKDSSSNNNNNNNSSNYDDNDDDPENDFVDSDGYRKAPYIPNFGDSAGASRSPAGPSHASSSRREHKRYGATEKEESVAVATEPQVYASSSDEEADNLASSNRSGSAKVTTTAHRPTAVARARGTAASSSSSSSAADRTISKSGSTPTSALRSAMVATNAVSNRPLDPSVRVAQSMKARGWNVPL